MTEVEAAVRAHARRVMARDPAVQEDLSSGAQLSPPDLLDRLFQSDFETFDLVAHARVGAHHVFKTKLVGPLLVVLQARWAQDPDGRWRIREAEISRTEARCSGGAPGSSTSSGIA